MDVIAAFLRILLNRRNSEELQPLLESERGGNASWTESVPPEREVPSEVTPHRDIGSSPIPQTQRQFPTFPIASLSRYQLEVIPMTILSHFPPISETFSAPCTDKNPVEPVFFGSAIIPFQDFDHTTPMGSMTTLSLVIPCKITPALWPNVCHVPLDGKELVHTGKYNIVPYDREKIELVRGTLDGLPYGRQCVVGGVGVGGEELYHAVGLYNGLRIPGKVSVALAKKVRADYSLCISRSCLVPCHSLTVHSV